MHPHFVHFLVASLVLAVIPGPGILYVLARTLAGGKREGIWSILGTATGGMMHVVAAALGVSAILARSALAFQTVKYVGAAYLVYIGVRTILQREVDDASLEQVEAVEREKRASRHGSAFGQGVLTEALNPKTALFFLSFIPQFVDASGPGVFAQFVSLGAVTLTLNSLVDLVVVFLAATIGPRLVATARRRRQQRVVSGGAMIALGAYAAVAETPSSR